MIGSSLKRSLRRIVEVASSGHSDPIGLLFLVLMTGWILGERRVLSMMGYTASVLARLLPLAFAPIIARRFKAHHLLLAAALIVLGFVPYAGARGELFSGLRAYAENWDYNSVVYPVLRSALEESVAG